MFGGVFAPAIVLICSVVVFRQDPKKPRYVVIILKRVLLALSIALVTYCNSRPDAQLCGIPGSQLAAFVCVCIAWLQSFRIASFMLTALPGPAPHCRLNFNTTCVEEHPNDTTQCVIPNPGAALFPFPRIAVLLCSHELDPFRLQVAEYVAALHAHGRLER